MSKHTIEFTYKIGDKVRFKGEEWEIVAMIMDHKYEISYYMENGKQPSHPLLREECELLVLEDDLEREATKLAELL